MYGGSTLKYLAFLLLLMCVPIGLDAFAQVETTEQQTYSGDLLNDPIAIEILQKIEESKIKIAKLQQQNFENLQAQKFLEDRRAVALERLNQDLISWEAEWHEFSPKVAYQKFIDKKPSSVQGIFAKQFEFTETKHELGAYAKNNALDNGMTTPKALEMFNAAAASTVSELNKHNEKIQPDTPEEIRTKIAIWIGDVDDFNRIYSDHHAAFKGELSAKYAVEVKNERMEFKDALNKYNSGVITYQELSEQLIRIGEKYLPIKEQILEDNSKALSEYEARKMSQAQSIIDGINSDGAISSLIEAVWNYEIHSIEIIRK